VSRAIHIRVSESVVRTVHVDDGVCAALEMLPILAPERMAEILARELEAIGFVRDGDRATRTGDDGLEITIDVRAATVTVRLGDDADVSAQVTMHGRGGARTLDADRARVRKRVRSALDAKIDERTGELRQQITARLEDALADVRAELDGAIGRTTIAALTERAGQLGEIESVVDEGNGNVTIKVKL
jgi:hypothetical protein